MARVTIEDCLDNVENRFALVLLATKRARNLMKGTPALVQTQNKEAVTALREIAAGHITFDADLHELLQAPPPVAEMLRPVVPPRNFDDEE